MWKVPQQKLKLFEPEDTTPPIDVDALLKDFIEMDPSLIVGNDDGGNHADKRHNHHRQIDFPVLVQR